MESLVDQVHALQIVAGSGVQDDVFVLWLVQTFETS